MSALLWGPTVAAAGGPGDTTIHELAAPQAPRAAGQTPRHAPAAINGANSDCSAWKLVFLDLGFFDLDVEIAEEGWVWVNGTSTTDKFRDASGVVTKSKVAHNDTPANHFSHDWNVDIHVDPNQEGLLSDVNGTDEGGTVPTKIEMEWELGITPGERTGDGANPFLPRWVLPNVGDRVWTNGHWVFDCGHATSVGGVDHFRTEIHPGRALASMRRQAGTLPGSGTTPVPVTATDLYIHGRNGFMVQQLECGVDTILVEITHSCPTKTTPIDELYEFDVCLPVRPVSWARLAWSDVAGPGDSGIGVEPTIERRDAAGGCLQPDGHGNGFDTTDMLHVSVDLRGSGIDPDDVYARQIVSGWVFPPTTPLPHLSLTLDKLDLHADHEGLNFDGEFTFWWMGVGGAPQDEWHRLVNYEIPTDDDSGPLCFDHTNRLNDMDDDANCGNGELPFSGPTWDFYQLHDTPIRVATRGFEQDCYDDHFGSGHFSISMYVDCHFGNFFQETANDWGNNDPLPDLNGEIGGQGIDPTTLPADQELSVPGEFDFEFTLAQVAPADEDTADLGTSKSCAWDGEVALAGEPFTCTIVVTNPGPGLPRGVVVTDTLSSTLSGADYSVSQATFEVGGVDGTFACGSPTDGGFACDIGTVPVGGSVTIEVVITPTKPGRFTNLASVATDSTDEDSGNDGSTADVDVYQAVQVDIAPGSTTNAINLGKKGVVAVAILTTPDFDASALAVTEVCFGDADAPGQRTCAEVHGTVHSLDVDRDRDVDALFHFDVLTTGIDPGDATACIKGTLSTGVGFYGCDVVSTR